MDRSQLGEFSQRQIEPAERSKETGKRVPTEKEKPAELPQVRMRRELSVIDRSADLKALVNRLTKAANAPAVADQMRADLKNAADIVWEYIVLIEPDDTTQNAPTPSAFSGSIRRQSRGGLLVAPHDDRLPPDIFL